MLKATKNLRRPGGKFLYRVQRHLVLPTGELTPQVTERILHFLLSHLIRLLRRRLPLSKKGGFVGGAPTAIGLSPTGGYTRRIRRAPWLSL